MTTRKELQAWLDQFPEDAVVKCMCSYTNSHGYESFTSVHATDFDLSERVDQEFSTWAKTFEIERGRDGEVIVQLGVHE